MPTWSDLLTALVARQELSREDATWAMQEVMSGAASDVQTAGFMVALRAKGETVTELAALADTMLAHAVPCPVPGRTVDIVGTGGDRTHTVNISTMASLVIAGTGLKVVKHGNRAASSSSGSADVLEALGIRLDHAPSRVAELADEVGITFCFARTFHPAMRHVGVARSELGIATVFNFLGPITNPGRPAAAAVGCADARMAPLMAGVFASRGTGALVFRGDRGLDELAATGPADVWEATPEGVVAHVIDPVADLGLSPITLGQLRGQDASYNAGVVREVLAGTAGPVRETVELNAAAALVADGTLPGTGAQAGALPERLRAGIALAAESIDSGRAADVLDRWVAAAR